MEMSYEEIANRLKLLSHPVRLQILDALRREARCVCHLETVLQRPQPYISQQLAVLRSEGRLPLPPVQHHRADHVASANGPDSLSIPQNPKKDNNLSCSRRNVL